jgi:hypothetical protein
MRFTHKAGEKMFIDFSGDRAHYQDPATGKAIEADLFVSVLGASSYLFARATPDQSTESFIDCTIRAFEFYGGSTEYLVPDNARSVVTHPSYYDPISTGHSLPWQSTTMSRSAGAGPQGEGQGESRERRASGPEAHPGKAPEQDFFSLQELNDCHHGRDEGAERTPHGRHQQIAL